MSSRTSPWRVIARVMPNLIICALIIVAAGRLIVHLSWTSIAFIVVVGAIANVLSRLWVERRAAASGER